MVALALLAAQLLGTEELIELRFKWVPPRGRITVIVESGQLASPKRSEKREYWFRRTVDDGRAKSISWADTLRCPQSQSVLYGAVKVPPPRAVIYGVDDPAKDGVIVTADGPYYEVTINAQYGNHAGSELHFSGLEGSPLANWIGESLRSLDKCWRTKRPADPLL